MRQLRILAVLFVASAGLALPAAGASAQVPGVSREAHINTLARLYVYNAHCRPLGKQWADMYVEIYTKGTDQRMRGDIAAKVKEIEEEIVAEYIRRFWCEATDTQMKNFLDWSPNETVPKRLPLAEPTLKPPPRVKSGDPPNPDTAPITVLAEVRGIVAQCSQNGLPQKWKDFYDKMGRRTFILMQKNEPEYAEYDKLVGERVEAYRDESGLREMNQWLDQQMEKVRKGGKGDPEPEFAKNKKWCAEVQPQLLKNLEHP